MLESTPPLYLQVMQCRLIVAPIRANRIHARLAKHQTELPWTCAAAQSGSGPFDGSRKAEIKEKFSKLQRVLLTNPVFYVYVGQLSRSEDALISSQPGL